MKTSALAFLATVLVGSGIWQLQVMLVGQSDPAPVQVIQPPPTQAVINVLVDLVPSHDSGAPELPARRVGRRRPRQTGPSSPGKWFAGPRGWEWVTTKELESNGAPIIE